MRLMDAKQRFGSGKNTFLPSKSAEMESIPGFLTLLYV
jgi:hypothetical protein